MHRNSSSSPTNGAEDTHERIAKPYRDEGYEVIVRPREDQVPPFAVGFPLDLIATRGTEGVIVVIKRNRIDLSRDPAVLRLAEAVDAQPGWRLDVVVLEAVTALEKATQDAVEPSDEQLAQILKTAEELNQSGYSPSACVVAWGGLEAAMRRWQDEGRPHGRATPTELMQSLYGNGFLTREPFDRLKEAYKIRNQVVHGLVPPRVDPELVRSVVDAARSLMNGREAVLSR
jgi:REase_AHJR-like